MKPTQAKARLLDFVCMLSNMALQKVCMTVLDHQKFLTQFGSSGGHHAYLGGLAVHTCEVTDYAFEMCKTLFPQADLDIIIVAAIFHDFMKIDEYEAGEISDPKPTKTQYRKLVRHVAGSHAEFLKAVVGKNIDNDTILNIQHAILAHHGRKECGSPIEPQTIEAHMIHFADTLSVKFGPHHEHICNTTKQAPKALNKKSQRCG